MIEDFTKGMGRMMVANMSTEMIYSFVIIVCSLMIYFGTKEIYELSNYKGLKYFRESFLFFACAYFFRSFIKFIMIYFNSQGILLVSPRILNPIISKFTLGLFIYFSSIGIFYLLYSVNWKKWDSKENLLIFHLTSILIAMFSIFSKNPLSYLGINLFLFVFVIIAVYSSYIQSKKKNKKGRGFYFVYLLLSFFWILNIIEILIPSFFQTIQLIIYLFSLGIFLLILYKVLRKTGN